MDPQLLDFSQTDQNLLLQPQLLGASVVPINFMVPPVPSIPPLFGASDFGTTSFLLGEREEGERKCGEFKLHVLSTAVISLYLYISLSHTLSFSFSFSFSLSLFSFPSLSFLGTQPAFLMDTAFSNTSSPVLLQELQELDRRINAERNITQQVMGSLQQCDSASLQTLKVQRRAGEKEKEEGI